MGIQHSSKIDIENKGGVSGSDGSVVIGGNGGSITIKGNVAGGQVGNRLTNCVNIRVG